MYPTTIPTVQQSKREGGNKNDPKQKNFIEIMAENIGLGVKKHAGPEFHKLNLF